MEQRGAFVNGEYGAWSQNVKEFQSGWGWFVQQSHVEIVPAQLAICFLVVSIQFGRVGDQSIRATFHAYFQRWMQLGDVQKEEEWSIDCVHAGEFEILEFLIRGGATGVSKTVIAVDQTYWIAVNETKDSNNNL